MSYDFLKTPIEYLKGVGPKRADLLKSELEIFTFGELMKLYPYRYIDRSKFHTIREVIPGNHYFQIKGKITDVQSIGAKRTTRIVARFSDGTGELDLVWFAGITWIKDKIKKGQEYVVFGKANFFKGRINIPHPELSTLEEFKTPLGETLQAFYPSTEKLKTRGLDSRGISKIVKNLFLVADKGIPETLPPWILERFKMMSRQMALQNIHLPSGLDELEQAKKRLKFEELFFIQLQVLSLKGERKKNIPGYTFSTIGDHFNKFFKNNLPFELTNAQKKVIKEIRKDIGSGVQMNRLLQGDVGSGKTLVALMCMLIAIDNGCQTAIMAPTEILAQQHYQTIREFLEGINIRVRLLTGSTKTAERRSLLADLAEGEIDILIGTHALIEDKVVFKKLGFVVIDEQHRFGVAQRAKLWKKGSVAPHVLVMTATPIPRTLAMTLYGDLDFSVIDELPPGRKPVVTQHYFDSKRSRVFGFMKEQIALGRQVYVVYPLIEESSKLDLKDLMDGYESISRAFPLPDYAISIVHGKMKAEEKDYEMQRFAKGETQIMVSTTVIEVGVNIPNASVMIIENAERFGLSQLHQLRGRVGRGADQSYCILMSGNKLTADGKKRLSTMVESTDGFYIADVDLKLRGPGDMQGTRQSGVLELLIADITKDEKILNFARDLAIKILDKDPQLSHTKNVKLKEELKRQQGSRINWGQIS